MINIKNIIKKKLLIFGNIIAISSPLTTIIACNNDKKNIDSFNKREIIYPLSTIIEKLKRDKILKDDFDLENSFDDFESKKNISKNIFKAIIEDKGNKNKYIKLLFTEYSNDFSSKIFNNNNFNIFFQIIYSKGFVNLLFGNDIQKVIKEIFNTNGSINILKVVEKVIKNSDENKENIETIKEIVEKIKVKNEYIFSLLAKKIDFFEKNKNEIYKIMNFLKDGFSKKEKIEKQTFNAFPNWKKEILGIFGFIDFVLPQKKDKAKILNFFRKGINKTSSEEIVSFIKDIYDKYINIFYNKFKNKIKSIKKYLEIFLLEKDKISEEKISKIAKIIKYFAKSNTSIYS